MSFTTEEILQEFVDASTGYQDATVDDVEGSMHGCAMLGVPRDNRIGFNSQSGVMRRKTRKERLARKAALMRKYRAAAKARRAQDAAVQG